MTDIISELRQDINREKYQELWSKYGRNIIIFFLTVIFFFIFYIIYSQYQTKQQNLVSSLYAEFKISLEEKNILKAEALYKEIKEKDNGKIFSILANLKQNNHLKTSEVEGSLNRSSNYDFYREILFLKNFDYNDNNTFKDLKYLENEFYILKAFNAIENNNFKVARESFSMIIVNKHSSPEYKKLAMEFINYLDERKN